MQSKFDILRAERQQQMPNKDSGTPLQPQQLPQGNSQQNTNGMSKFDILRQERATSDNNHSQQEGMQNNIKKDASPQKEDPYTAFQRLAQLGRGVTNTYATLGDLVAKFSGGVVERQLEKHGLHDASNVIKERVKEVGDPQLLQKSQEWWNEKAGRDLTPTDIPGKLLTYGGEFASPLPVKGFTQAAKALQGGNVAAKVGHMAAKNIGQAAGAATGVTGAQALIGENEGWPKYVVEMIGALGGASVGNVAIQKALGKSAAKFEELLPSFSSKNLESQSKLADFVKKEFESLPKEDRPNFLQEMGGKLLSRLGDKTKDWDKLIQAARDNKIDLPFNIALPRSKPLNLMANNWFKSMFTSKSYNDIVNNADSNIIKNLKKTIEEIHPEEINATKASEGVFDFLAPEEFLLEKQQRHLYERAESLMNLRPETKVSVSPFVERGDKILKSMSDSPSGDRAKVYNKILDVYDKWGILSKEDKKISNELASYVGKMDGDTVRIPQEILDKALSIGKMPKKDITVLASKVENLRKDWNQLYDPMKKGFSKNFGSLTNGLKESLKTSPDKEYIEALFQADKFHEQNIAGRMRRDMAKSILKNEMPKEAFQYMNSLKNIEELSHILGESAQAKEIMQSLKRAKFTELFYEKAVGGDAWLDGDGYINYGKFANGIIKSGNEDLFEVLLGKEGLKSIEKLARVAQGFSNAGRQFGSNFSGTAPAKMDMDALKKGLNSVLMASAALGGSSFASGGSAMGVALSAASFPAIIRGLSAVLGDKKVVNSAIAYAKAYATGDFKRQNKALESLSIALDKMIEKPSIIETSKIARESNERKEASPLGLTVRPQ